MYHVRNSDKLLLSVMATSSGVSAAVLSGPPGVGKTSLGQWLAEQMSAECLYFLCHHWVTEEDLFVKLDPARVAGIAGRVPGVELDDAYRAGVLLRATITSAKQRVVVIVDELDKAPQRTDALLLDFLQTGRVHGPFGETWQANLSNLVVIITTNNERALSEALLRRCYRYEVPFLPKSAEADIIRHATGAPVGVCRMIVNLMGEIRLRGETSPSLQEGVRLANALSAATSADDVEQLIVGWLCKTAADRAVLPTKVSAALWGEWKRPSGDGK